MKKSNTVLLLIVVFIALALLAVFFTKSKLSPRRKVSTVWQEDFNSTSNWKLRTKPGTLPARFSIETGPGNDKYLRMEADKASGSLITDVKDIDLRETPVLEWRWRVETLPEGADSRNNKKDDQAIGIYVGTGNPLANKSISYRWDTDTPKGSEGNCVYGGVSRIKWITLRNKEDAGSNRWFTEKRNVAEDFKNAWGFYPDKIYLVISCNSQYTNSTAVADLDWIKIISISSGKEKNVTEVP